MAAETGAAALEQRVPVKDGEKSAPQNDGHEMGLVAEPQHAQQRSGQGRNAGVRNGAQHAFHKAGGGGISPLNPEDQEVDAFDFGHQSGFAGSLTAWHREGRREATATGSAGFAA